MLPQSTPDEIWKPIPDTDYEASTLGRIRRSGAGRGARVGRLVSQHEHRSKYRTASSYLKVRLSRKSYLVHTVVAYAFLGPRPEGLEINHVDGNKHNNRPENLEYITHRENQIDAFRRRRLRRASLDHQC